MKATLNRCVVRRDLNCSRHGAVLIYAVNLLQKVGDATLNAKLRYYFSRDTGCLPINIDVGHMFTNVDHTQGIHAVGEALQFPGTVYDRVMQFILCLIVNGVFWPLALQWAGTKQLIMLIYSENPLIEQGLSHDMSDKRECRNIESMTYR